MTIRSGPIFRLLKEMRPDFPFNVVQLNKFKSHRQCQWHVDRKNVGDSLFAMMGDFEGGALRLDDGRLFSQKYKWYRYIGALVGHEVLPFTGERITCVLYQDIPTTPIYQVTGDNVVPMNQEAAEAEQNHPNIDDHEDPAVAAERERLLAIAKEQARKKWKQLALAKDWDAV